MNLKHVCAASLLASALIGGPSLAAQQLKLDRQPHATAAVQGFNIVLLVGETTSSGASVEEVPPSARKALADMRDFLPFKNYRMLDTQWTSCCSPAMGTNLSGRLQGVIGITDTAGPVRLLARTFGYTLQVSPDANKLVVRFNMRQDDQPGRSPQGGLEQARMNELRREISDLERQRDQLAARRAQARDRLGEKHPDVIASEAEVSLVQRKLLSVASEYETLRAVSAGSNRSIIDSNFTMDVGETVVVGTSRLGGDKALIALVTAARKSGGPR